MIHDFRHAYIQAITFGPRREMTLTVAPMILRTPAGRVGGTVRVRFGGISNLKEVTACFATKPHEISELADLRYSSVQQSKPGRLVVELIFERIDAQLLIRCSSLRVDELAV